MNGNLLLSLTLAVSSLGSISSLASSENEVVRSRTTIPVFMGSISSTSIENQIIEGDSAAISSLVLDASKFVIPPVSNAPLDFGTLAISELLDRNLYVCGATHNLRCSTATIRVYTIGAGPGLYNETEGYSMPLTVNESTALGVVLGYGKENAAILKTITISRSRYTLRLSDFGVLPRYQFKSDFTEAGSGSFATSIVLEYVLR